MALLLFLLLGQAPQEDYELDKIQAAMSYPGVSISRVVWKDCGYPNAWYVYANATIELCNELRAEGKDVVQLFFAHEMGHAIIDQKPVIVPGSEEVAADELAVLHLMLTGRESAVRGASRRFYLRGGLEDFTDDHPSDRRRAFLLNCYARGPAELRTGVETMCGQKWRRLLVVWRYLLEVY